jgi:hypothetical protein
MVFGIFIDAGRFGVGCFFAFHGVFSLHTGVLCFYPTEKVGHLPSRL